MNIMQLRAYIENMHVRHRRMGRGRESREWRLKYAGRSRERGVFPVNERDHLPRFVFILLSLTFRVTFKYILY